MTDPTGQDGPAEGRAVRIVRGQPTEDELAALVTVLAARSGGRPDPASDQSAAPSAWQDRSRYLRTTLPHGPGAWRASAWHR